MASIDEKVIRRAIDDENHRQLSQAEYDSWVGALKRRQMLGEYVGAPESKQCPDCFLVHAGECF